MDSWWQTNTAVNHTVMVSSSTDGNLLSLRSLPGLPRWRQMPALHLSIAGACLNVNAVGSCCAVVSHAFTSETMVKASNKRSFHAIARILFYHVYAARRRTKIQNIDFQQTTPSCPKYGSQRTVLSSVHHQSIYHVSLPCLNLAYA